MISPDPAAERAWHKTVPLALVVAAMLLTGVAALVVTPGLPYDEPSHWSTVTFISTHWRLPVLGEPGVSYEGQQTPLYYVAAAVIASVGGDAAFILVRLLNVVGFGVVVLLTWFILVRVAGHGLVTVVGTAFVALNPMLIVMSGSVQNDTWALVWALSVIAIALYPVRSRWAQGVLVGLFSGLAILTKVSMAPALVGVVLAYFVTRRVREPVVAVAVSSLLCGWWVVRNLVLYGDLTGQSAVELTGVVFENSPKNPVEIMQTVLAYLTIPVEYVRNTISAPILIDALVLVLGAAIALGMALLLIRDRRVYRSWGLLVLIAVSVTTVVAWLLQNTFGWPVAFRTAYASLPLFALAIGASTSLFRGRTGPAILAVLIIAIELVILGWTLAALSLEWRQPMLWGAG